MTWFKLKFTVKLLLNTAQFADKLAGNQSATQFIYKIAVHLTSKCVVLQLKSVSYHSE